MAWVCGYRTIALLVCLLAWPAARPPQAAPPASAGAASVTLVDAAGAPVDNAVVALMPAPGAPVPASTSPSVALDQINKQFVPHVLAIQVGTTIYFPNSDNIRHQVYSFSDAKRFEIKLYAGKSAPPVLFDKAGVVVMGCNIHDWMSAYLYVVDTPYFGMTDTSGHVQIRVPRGAYTLQIWHPRHQRGREPLSSDVQVSHDVDEVHATLSLAPVDDSSGIPPSAGATP